MSKKSWGKNVFRLTSQIWRFSQNPFWAWHNTSWLCWKTNPPFRSKLQRLQRSKFLWLSVFVSCRTSRDQSCDPFMCGNDIRKWLQLQRNLRETNWSTVGAKKLAKFQQKESIDFSNLWTFHLHQITNCYIPHFSSDLVLPMLTTRPGDQAATT